MTSNQIIESLKEVIVSLKAQLEVYRLEREQDKRQINALMSIITGLRKEISSLREAIDGRNEDLEKAKSINKGLSKIIANKAEKQQPPQAVRGGKAGTGEETGCGRQGSRQQRSQTQHPPGELGTYTDSLRHP